VESRANPDFLRASIDLRVVHQEAAHGLHAEESVLRHGEGVLQRVLWKIMLMPAVWVVRTA